jgi:hypothetical protein
MVVNVKNPELRNQPVHVLLNLRLGDIFYWIEIQFLNGSPIYLKIANE